MKVVMLYDGLCGLCNQSQHLVHRLDWLGRVEQLNAQEYQKIVARFPELQDQDILGEIFVQTKRGDWQRGFFGMRYLARQLPLTWLILPFLYLPLMNQLGPKIYAWVAHRRYAFNRWLGNGCADGVCKIS